VKNLLIYAQTRAKVLGGRFSSGKSVTDSNAKGSKKGVPGYDLTNPTLGQRGRKAKGGGGKFR